MIRWGYAINQFNPQFDDFVRRRQHQRALRIISISGFSGVELSAGSGRWEPLGNPTQITANFGSIAAFADFVREAGLDAVSSWYWDPWLHLQEDLTHGDDPSNPESLDGLVAHAVWFAGALAELGGSVLVVRPAPYAGQKPTLTDDEIATIGHAWEAVATAIAGHGIRLGLHFDFLSSLRSDHGLERLLDATAPDLVGLALDTAEFAIAGLDPVSFIRTYRERIVHVHLKNAAATDGDNEYLTPAAEYTVLRAGGKRAVPRWYLELGTEPQLVDARAVVTELVEGGYEGWVVVESDFTPHQATSVMLNGWELQHVLAPLT